jgi:hypothetical protein
LTGGPVDGDQVVCPRHGARFSIKTGEALTPPAFEPVSKLPVRVEDGDRPGARRPLGLEPISKSPTHASASRRGRQCRCVCMFRAPQIAHRRSLWPVLPSTRRDSADLGAFRRRCSPGVRTVHGGDHRLELRPNRLVAYARDLSRF